MMQRDGFKFFLSHESRKTITDFLETTLTLIGKKIFTSKKLQKATEELFKLEELKKDISIANLYKN